MPFALTSDPTIVVPSIHFDICPVVSFDFTAWTVTVGVVLIETGNYSTNATYLPFELSAEKSPYLNGTDTPFLKKYL